MSYTVLARKWRPHNFADLVGQEHVVTALSNSLTSNRLHHAYLFTGTRGVGKTTVARILAKCLNCETGMTATPCDTCQSCQDINQGCAVDLIEVDAASKTKVEDTRDMLDNVQYMPTRLRYKIYLIDEVHMLSSHSFNALLKTLEEPPEHVIFLLATTDPQKLPITVLSRCLQFHLKNMLPEQIQSHLAHVLESEKLPFEPGALTQISIAANGSMRDALSLLDQTIAYCAGNITDSGARAMLGTVAQYHVDELLLAVSTHNSVALIEKVKSLAELGVDYQNVADEIINTLHQLALYHHIPNAIDPLYAQTQFSALAQGISPEDTQLFYQIALHGRRDLPLSPNPRYGLEMMLLRMMIFKPGQQRPTDNKTESTPMPSSNPQSSQHNSSVPNTVSVQAESSDTKPLSGQAESSETKPLTRQAESSEKKPLSGQDETWFALVPRLAVNGMTKMIVNHCALNQITDTDISLEISSKHATLLNDTQQSRIQNAINAVLGQNLKLKMTISETVTNTPAAQEEEESQAKLNQAIATLDADPNLAALTEAFSAKVIPQSITIEE